MTLALAWGDDTLIDLNNSTSGFIYFDAVTVFTQNFSGQVTKHPVDSGGSISDHFTANNPRFTVSAVISTADISISPYNIILRDGASPYNVRETPTEVIVKSSNSSMLQKFIPDSAGQFMTSASPEVIVDTVRVNLQDNIRDILSRLVYSPQSKNTPVDNRIQLVRLLEFDGRTLRRTTVDLVLTSVAYKEDYKTGDAIYCDLAFERVTFAFLQQTVIPKNIIALLKKKAAPKAAKGTADSTEVVPTSIDRDKEKGNYKQTADQQFGLGSALNTGSLGQ
jgi:hypothetical protein